MNRTFATVLLTGFLTTGAALAQTAATNSSATPPAVSTSDADAKTSAAPVAGKNSFTEDQVVSRLKDHGFTGAKGLAKDELGVWRGTAMKDGKDVKVSVDFQGNITER